MILKTKHRIIIFLFILFTQSIFADYNYVVEFSGIENKDILTLLNNVSETKKRQDSPPASLVALKKRAEGDIERFKQALQSEAFYNPTIKVSYNLESIPITITYSINKGALYPIYKITIDPDIGIKAKDFGLDIGGPAYPKDIIKAEKKLTELLKNAGYPFAKIESKEVIADIKNKNVTLIFNLNIGKQAYFGQSLIIGNTSVKESVIYKQINWCKGQKYNPELVETTIQNLENTGLFTSVSITGGQELVNEKYLPMMIEVSEAKHRTIGLGAGYSTYRGFGFTAEWENRNFRGLGEKLGFDTNLYFQKHEATLYYLKPGFGHPDQDLILQTEFDHEKVKAYDTTGLTFSALLQRQFTPCSRLSWGLQYKQLRDTDTDNNGNFSLLKFPIMFNYTNVQNPLDPTYGFSLFLNSVPTGQLIDDKLYYNKNLLSVSCYIPLTRDSRFVFAGRGLFGSILGASRRSIPPSERFYAGSDTTLRGYNYLTVSPLDTDNDPVGGRSMLIYSLEGRYKINDTWGAALFYDIGNVFRNDIPRFNKKMLQSVGFGARYYTPVAPIRLDVAFPLNRRKKTGKNSYLDSPFQVYFSIGQSF